jgi:hypothetical protein
MFNRIERYKQGTFKKLTNNGNNSHCFLSLKMMLQAMHASSRTSESNIKNNRNGSQHTEVSFVFFFQTVENKIVEIFKLLIIVCKFGSPLLQLFLYVFQRTTSET